MSLLSKLIIFIIIFAFSFQNLFAADIPIIVIAPSKKVQSISVVGSSTTVYDENDIKNDIKDDIKNDIKDDRRKDNTSYH